MKAKDLRSMSKTDLNSKLTELRKELIKHNAQIATGTTPKSPGQVREVKKTIAKILTIVGSQGLTKLGDRKSSSAGAKEAPSTKSVESKEEKPSKEKEIEKPKTPAKKTEEE